MINGVVDYLGRGLDGAWQLVNFKTGPILDRAEAVEHHRLQLEIYSLYLALQFPEQDHYQAILYFTDMDESHRLMFKRRLDRHCQSRR